MSNVKELADAEAERAEAEQPDTDEPDTDEGDESEAESLEAPEPTPSTDPTEADRKAFQREFDRHAKELHKIMGDDFGLLEVCDECGGMGFAPPVTFRANEKYKACETCAGMGDVRTGSKKAGAELRECPTCGGRGYLERLPEQPAASPTANGETQQTPQYGTPSWMGNPEVTPGAYVAPPVG